MHTLGISRWTCLGAFVPSCETFLPDGPLRCTSFGVFPTDWHGCGSPGATPFGSLPRRRVGRLIRRDQFAAKYQITPSAAHADSVRTIPFLK